jgi:hypothetical protein
MAISFISTSFSISCCHAAWADEPFGWPAFFLLLLATSIAVLPLTPIIDGRGIFVVPMMRLSPVLSVVASVRSLIVSKLPFFVPLNFFSAF